MFLTLTAMLALDQLPTFAGGAPGLILPVNTPVVQGSVNPKLISGLLKIELTGLSSTFAAQPRSTEHKLFLTRFESRDPGWCYVALPFATHEKYRDVTLMIDEKAYKLRLPVTKSIGPNFRKPSTAKIGGVTVNASFSERRFSTEHFRIKLVAKNGLDHPVLVGASWIPQKTSGPVRDPLLGMGMVQLIEGQLTRDLVAQPPQQLGSSTIDIKVLPLKSKPITLRATRSSTVPYEYFLNGKKIFNRYHKLLPDSGFDVLRINNLYFSNFGIRGRPPGNPPSYASIKDGETFQATGYTRISKAPASTILKVDSPPPVKETHTGLMPVNIYIEMP